MTPDQHNDTNDDDDDNFDSYDADFDQDDQSVSRHSIAAPIDHPRKVAQSTIDLYIRYVKTMRRQFMSTFPDAHLRDVQPIDLVDFLFSRASSMRPKTFINYRCGLLYWLNTAPATADTHHAILLLQVGTPKSGFKGARPGQVATIASTRSCRPRTFKKIHFDKLINELNGRAARMGDKRTTRRSGELLLWLQAGLASGLRPIEWETARWEDKSKGLLLVQTAKTKHDVYALPSLANLPAPVQRTRVVPVDLAGRLWVDQHLLAVKRHLREGRSFRSYYQNNRMYLRNACQDIFGSDGPSFHLYLMRGQFAANRKRAGLTIDQVGAEMGCAGKVSSTYYGNRVHGHGASVSHADKQAQVQKDAQKVAQKVGKSRFSFSR